MLKIKRSVFLTVFFLFIMVILTIVLYPSRFLGNGKKETKKIYFADNISPAHEELIKRFNKKYENEIEVVPINLPFSKFSTNERKELLARSLRSNSDRLDIFAVDIIWVPRFARWAYDLDFEFSMTERANFLDFVLESCYYENKLVAYPFITDIGLLYYREDLIKQMSGGDQLITKLKTSITWQEFTDLGLNMSEYNERFYLFPAKSYEGLICSFLELVLSQKENLFKDIPIELNTKAARKSLKLLVNLVHSYKLSPDNILKFDEFNCYEYALKNDVPFVRGWPGFQRHYRHIFKDTVKMDKYKLAALPHFENSRAISVYGGWNLMIPVNSMNKKEAVTFIRFIHEPENQKIMYEKGGYIPIVADLYSDKEFTENNKELLYYHDLLERGVYRPKLENYTKLSDIISYYIHLAIKKEITVDQALTRATKDINTNRVLIK